MAAPLISFSGIATGIDSASLIQSLLDQERSAKTKPLSEKITQLTDENSGLSKLSELLGSLRSAADKFRVLNGGGVSKLASSSNESSATASASNGAASGTYQINTTQLAKNATYSFQSTAGTYSSSSDLISGGAAFGDTVTVKIGDPLAPKDTVNVNVNESTTLSDFVTEFNSQTQDATASVVNVGSSATPDYRIMINSNNSGTAAGELSVTVGGVLSGRNAFNNNTSDAAKNAQFTITGISGTIERATNTITDVVPGLTVNLRDIGSATISVAPDSTATSQALQDVVDAYNEIIDYVADNDTITRDDSGSEVKNVWGKLARTQLDNNALSSLRSAFFSTSISGGQFNTLWDIGLKTERDGTMSFDKSVMADALAKDPTSIDLITQKLGESLSATGGTIDQYTRFNGLIETSENSNKTLIDSMQNRITEVEKALEKKQEVLTQRFSKLEALSAKMSSQQSALASMGT